MQGKLIHAHIITTGLKASMFLLNNLLYMYCTCGDSRNARKLFDNLPQRNTVSYNSLISGYVQMGLYGSSIGVFKEATMAGLKLDKLTYAGAFRACAQIRNLELGKLIHGMVTVSGVSSECLVTNSIIDMYSKCGRVDQARALFENTDALDDVSWNSMIAGYVRIGAYDDMLRLLVKMNQTGLTMSTYALGSILKACCTNFSNSLMVGKMLHCCSVKLGLDLDIVVGTALLDMYAKTGELTGAKQIFKTMPDRNVVMYNAMISGLLQTEAITDECAHEAFDLFSSMKMKGMKPSEFTFSSILKACHAVEAFGYGEQIHTQVIKNHLQSDEFIGSTLIDLYASLGSVEDGLKCFNLTPKQDIVSWTSVIAGQIRNGKFEKALALFYELLATGLRPDEFTISSMLGACADMAAEKSGVQIQSYAIKSALGNFTVVQNSQLFMYAKSGDLDSATKTFNETSNPDVVSWSAMICSNAQHGYAKESLELFELMENHGISPNQITFLGVLTACSHGGLVEEGLR